MKQYGSYAFPIVVGDQMTPGMMIRDWFAGQALIGVLMQGGYGHEDAAKEARGYADAMIAELEATE